MYRAKSTCSGCSKTFEVESEDRESGEKEVLKLIWTHNHDCYSYEYVEHFCKSACSFCGEEIRSIRSESVKKNRFGKRHPDYPINSEIMRRLEGNVCSMMSNHMNDDEKCKKIRKRDNSIDSILNG